MGVYKYIEQLKNKESSIVNGKRKQSTCSRGNLLELEVVVLYNKIIAILVYGINKYRINES